MAPENLRIAAKDRRAVSLSSNQFKASTPSPASVTAEDWTFRFRQASTPTRPVPSKASTAVAWLRHGSGERSLAPGVVSYAQPRAVIDVGMPVAVAERPTFPLQLDPAEVTLAPRRES